MHQDVPSLNTDDNHSGIRNLQDSSARDGSRYGKTEDRFCSGDVQKYNYYCQSAGYFCYLDDNHTSVLGMREIAFNKGASAVCVTADLLRKQTHVLNGKECCSGGASVNHEESLRKNPRNKSVNSLFAYPGQSNFSGVKYPLSWSSAVRNGHLNLDTIIRTGQAIPLNPELSNLTGVRLSPYLDHTSSENPKDTESTGQPFQRWYTLLDAAGLVSTSHLDLQIHDPDFVTLSFYKMFGFPTGLGM